MLLIAPIWNGNSSVSPNLHEVIGLLIAPIWNGNFSQGHTGGKQGKTFNRTNLEWKPEHMEDENDESNLLIAPIWNGNFLDRDSITNEDAFNRTNLEWKRQPVFGSAREGFTFNRTNLEWKRYAKSTYEAKTSLLIAPIWNGNGATF